MCIEVRDYVPKTQQLFQAKHSLGQLKVPETNR